MRRPPVKVMSPSIVDPAPIRLSIGLALLVFPNIYPSLRHIDRPGQFNLSPGYGKYANFHTFERGPGWNREPALDLVIEAEFEASALAGGHLGEGERIHG